MMGFVDVSNMTDEQIKRLNHMDELDVPAQRRRYNRRPAPVMVNTAEVFTAAAAAHRINSGEYIKVGASVADPENGPYAFKPHPLKPNREIMASVLSGEIATTDADQELGQAIMTHYKGLTLRLLAGKLLNEFEQKSLHLASSETMSDRDIAVVASLPSSYARAMVRKSAEERLADCESSYLGKVGNKITVAGEVIRCTYSQQWNTYYVTMITDTNHCVFFGTRGAVNAGSAIKVFGNVKAHRDNFQTQLNYAKII